MPETTIKAIERRRHRRESVHFDVRCIRLDPHEGGIIDNVDLVDLSQSGVGAVSENWYYPGQKVVVCLPADATHGSRQVKATVKRCLSRHAPGYRIGMEFDHNARDTWVNQNTELAVA
ncbi:MAG: PilZ domain-containing protein [Phycisphaerales bacterium]|jgi:hypothetical protein|nr:PilZ domain-containing protein [Phycisphaerales bacterium]